MLLLSFLLGVLLSGVVLTILYPQIVQRYVDQIDRGSEKALYLLAFAFLGVVFLKNCLKLLAQLLSNAVSWSIANSLRYRICKKLLYSDYQAFQSLKTGLLTQTLDNDIFALMSFFSDIFLNILVNGLVILGIILVVISKSFAVGVALTLFLGLSILVLTLISQGATPLWAAQKQAYEEFFSLYGEFTDLCEDFVFLRAQNRLLAKLKWKMESLFGARLLAALMGYHLWVASLASFAIVTVVTMLFCSVLVLRGSLSLGTAYMIIYYIDMLNNPVEEIRTKLESIQISRGSLDRINSIMALPRGMEYGHKEFPEAVERIEFQGVNFAYGEENILSDFNLSLKVGGINCIVGESGSGKSTLARLLSRLYDCDAGEVLINGVEIQSFSKESLRSNIDYISQRRFLTKTTLRQLLDSDGRLDDGVLKKALQQVGLEEWSQSLSQGLDEAISETELNLSEGEFQRLFIAKALLSPGQILILDEVSSQLDDQGVDILHASLEQLKTKKTLILISHDGRSFARYTPLISMPRGELLHGS